jgi:carboxypeptidase C (cathepsin A)
VRKIIRIGLLTLLIATAGPVLAESAAKDAAAEPKADSKPAVAAEQSVTQHRFANGATKFDYTATAGTAIIRDDDEKPIASMGYVAYTRSDVKDPTRRPIVFAFNGGPGSSSIWLHLGVLGPKRVVAVDAGPTPPAPYQFVDNPNGVLDHADLVMIDPVGTGISKAVGDKKDEDFWSVDPDIDSVSRFIAQYVSDHGRWNSPKYILGESYGTTRAAGVVDYLQTRRVMAFNGVILVSVALDPEAIFAEIPGNDRPYALFIPAFAITALHHGMLPGTPPTRDALIAEAKAYAAGPYTAALQKGDSLPASERDAVAARLHELTGLSVEYLKAANLRVSENAFAHELLKSTRRTVGRLDARFAGTTMDPLVKFAEYDPQSSAISSAYASAFMDYYHDELKFGAGKTYRPLNGAIYPKWRWNHQAGDGMQPSVNTGVDLAEAMVTNPSLRVLVVNGYYDLATPFSATEYMIDHLGLPPGYREHLTMKYYDAGHMMYVNPTALAQLKRDLDAFFEATNGLPNRP